MPIHRDRIIEYLRQGEGAPPPVFVGRDDILEDILTTSKDSAGQPKMTRIVQGAPGAGKTSLLHEMQKLWTGGKGTPRVVTVSAASVNHDTTGVIQAIMAAGTVSHTGWRRILQERLRRLASVGASVAGYGLSAEFDVYREARLLSTALRQGQERKWNHPVIVAVDEAQNLKGDTHSVSACFLQEIHNADTRLPLLLVFAGLSDTAAKARKMNLTRDIRIHETGPIPTAEARDFMRKLALYFGLDTSRHNPQLNAVADLCDGWPRHLRHAGETLGQTTLDMDGNMDRMDWTDIENDIWHRREAYYIGQNSPEIQQADILTSRVLAGLKDGMRIGYVEELVEDSIVDRPRQRLPEGKTTMGFINHLIHQGALYRSADGAIHSPIPSFRSFLIEKGTVPHPVSDRRKDDGEDGTEFGI